MAVFKMEKNGKITWASKFRFETQEEAYERGEYTYES